MRRDQVQSEPPLRRPGDLGLRERQYFQAFQDPGQRLDTGVGDLGMSQGQVPQLGHSLEVNEASIGDLSAIEINKY